MKGTMFGKALVGMAAGLFVGLFLIDCVSDLPPLADQPETVAMPEQQETVALPQ